MNSQKVLKLNLRAFVVNAATSYFNHESYPGFIIIIIFKYTYIWCKSEWEL